jgi:hypothetical protein
LREELAAGAETEMGSRQMTQLLCYCQNSWQLAQLLCCQPSVVSSVGGRALSKVRHQTRWSPDSGKRQQGRREPASVSWKPEVRELSATGKEFVHDAWFHFSNYMVTNKWVSYK